MKKYLFPKLLLLAAIFSSLVSCQKDISGELGTGGNTAVDLGSKVTSSVSGFVADENDQPVSGAAVKVGNRSVNTDAFGFFEVKNVEVSKNAATVTVNKTGYFPGIRTYMATNNKSAVVKIKLLPKQIAGTISAANGGSVTLANGLKISLPANAVVNAATGAAYSGTIQVAAQWLNPTAADLDRIMPGDLRAIDANNNMKLLITYGMAAVELIGSTGEKLQVATGQKAKLNFPLPASIAGTAPASIPLWHFDESTGLWKEEGSAVKVGNNYEGEVSHFSFWNCDVPQNYVQLTMTLHDAMGNPVQNAYVKITNTANNTTAAGITDQDGYVQGAVPSNSQLKMEVFTGFFCGVASHTQTINTTNTNIALGTVVINNSGTSISISGNVNNCNGQPVSNGWVIVKMNGFYNRYALNSTGNFNVLTPLCPGSTSIDIIPGDDATMQQGALTTHAVTTGSNPLGTLLACGISSSQFLNITVNGTPHSFTTTADSLAYYNNNQTMSNVNAFRISGTGTAASVAILFSNTGLAVGSTQSIVELTTSYITEPVTFAPGGTVNITEYGAIGEFISGTFNRTATGVAAPNTVYNITGNFRIRRYN